MSLMFSISALDHKKHTLSRQNLYEKPCLQTSVCKDPTDPKQGIALVAQEIVQGTEQESAAMATIAKGGMAA